VHLAAISEIMKHSIFPHHVLAFLFKMNQHTYNSPLFCGMDSSPLTYSNFSRQLSSLLLRAGYNPKGYFGHFFQRGATSTMAQLGFTDLEIQQLGWWQSDT